MRYLSVVNNTINQLLEILRKMYAHCHLPDILNISNKFGNNKSQFIFLLANEKMGNKTLNKVIQNLIIRIYYQCSILMNIILKQFNPARYITTYENSFFNFQELRDPPSSSQRQFGNWYPGHALGLLPLRLASRYYSYRMYRPFVYLLHTHAHQM